MSAVALAGTGTAAGAAAAVNVSLTSGNQRLLRRCGLVWRRDDLGRSPLLWRPPRDDYAASIDGVVVRSADGVHITQAAVSDFIGPALSQLIANVGRVVYNGNS